MAVIKIQTGLRLDEQTYGKLKAISDQEGRSLNNLVEYVLKRYLQSYEQEHGSILPAQSE